jgi:hypothetical protein
MIPMKNSTTLIMEGEQVIMHTQAASMKEISTGEEDALKMNPAGNQIAMQFIHLEEKKIYTPICAF